MFMSSSNFVNFIVSMYTCMFKCTVDSPLPLPNLPPFPPPLSHFFFTLLLVISRYDYLILNLTDWLIRQC